jgi:hypothetical protein
MMDFIKIERINRQDIVLLFMLEGINGSGRESKDYILRGFTPIFQPISSQSPIYAANQATTNESRKCRSHKANPGKYLASIKPKIRSLAWQN